MNAEAQDIKFIKISTNKQASYFVKIFLKKVSKRV